MAVWVFDVDGCLVDSLTGTSLRPGAAELLADLRRQKHEVCVWSAGGAEYAEQRAREHGIDRLIDRFQSKDARDEAGRYITDGIQDGLEDIVFVDDRPEDLPIGAAVVAVPPYLSQDRYDRGLMRAGWSGPKVPSGSEGEVLD